VNRIQPSQLSPLSGSLLLAHPTLTDPNFRETVVLLSAHSEGDGAIGVILNRPTGKNLAELYPEEGFQRLGHVQIFFGGPVEHERLILAAWKWSEEEKAHKLFFGISVEHAMELINSDEPATIRGYLGYAGWSAGQLESELASDSWLCRPIRPGILDSPDHEGLWKELVHEEPEEHGPGPWDDLLDPPEDPGLN